MSRRDYPNLYDFANSNQLLLSETDWENEMQGMYAGGDGKTNFRVPDLRGQFLRGLDDDRGVDLDRNLGSQQGDAIRNIIGECTTTSGNENNMHLSTKTYGAFYPREDNAPHKRIAVTEETIYSNRGAVFNASRVVPTAEENRPKNTALIAQIKY